MAASMATSMHTNMATNMAPSEPWNEHHPVEYFAMGPGEDGRLHQVPFVVDNVPDAVDPGLASGLGTEEATEDINLCGIDLDLVDFVLARETQPAFTDSGNIINAEQPIYEQPAYEQVFNQQATHEQLDLNISVHETQFKRVMEYYIQPLDLANKIQMGGFNMAMNLVYGKLQGNVEARKKILASVTPEAISGRAGFSKMPMAKLVAVVIEECWADGAYSDLDPTWRVSRDAFWAAMDVLTCNEMLRDRGTAMWVRSKDDENAIGWMEALEDLILE